MSDLRERVPRPMLARVAPLLEGAAFDRTFGHGDWRLEEKHDGHRCMVIVERGRVSAFSRPRGSRPANPRRLPEPMIAALAPLRGIFDGELVMPGGRCSDVGRRNVPLVLVLFDLLQWGARDITTQIYATRRAALLTALARLDRSQSVVTTVESRVPRWAEVQAIWARGGEGAVLKHARSVYLPGDRSMWWLKVTRRAYGL